MSFDEISLKNAVEFVVDNRGKTVPIQDTGIPLIATNCISNEHLYPEYINVRYVSEEIYHSWFRAHPQPDDIILTNKGSKNGAICLVPEPVGFCIAQDMVALRAKSNVIYPRYLFAALRSKLVQDRIKELNVDSVIPHFKKTDFDKLYFPLPSMDTQKLIGDSYYRFCRKIELNRKTNQTLEQMAQAIFKSWFVDFDPVKAKMNGDQPEGMDATTASLFPEKLVESGLGLVPEGWAVNKLSDICKNHSQSYDLKSVDEVVFVNTGDVQEGDFLHNDYSPVAGLPGQAKKAIKEDDILYSEIRPKNKRFAYVDFDVSDYVVSTKFMVIQANEKVHPRLLYMILTRQPTIDEFNIIADSRSGTFPQITFKAISNLEFCIAPRDVQEAFVEQVMPLIQLQGSLKKENKQLAELRDTLLPKLLSGEIELETK